MKSELTPLEPGLTIVEQARLVEIAHETRVPEIREAALKLLHRSFMPPLFAVTDDESFIAGLADLRRGAGY